MTTTAERRKTLPDSPGQLRLQLNPAQLRRLREMEHFGWELRFIRRPMFMEPLPVLVEYTSGKYAGLLPDGSLETPPMLKVRN